MMKINEFEIRHKALDARKKLKMTQIQNTTESIQLFETLSQLLQNYQINFENERV